MEETGVFSSEVFSVQKVSSRTLVYDTCSLTWWKKRENSSVCNCCIPTLIQWQPQKLFPKMIEKSLGSADVRAQAPAFSQMTDRLTLLKKPQKIHTHPRPPQALSFCKWFAIPDKYYITMKQKPELWLVIFLEKSRHWKNPVITALSLDACGINVLENGYKYEAVELIKICISAKNCDHLQLSKGAVWM